MSPDIRNVLVTGGAGYVGHVLTPRLLAEGYNVTVYDTLYFGCRLPNSPNLRVIQGDIRDTPRLAEALQGQDAVLHLACISNDASFELDEKLSETINYDCFEPMVVAAKAAGVKRFVYCSSSSVYGVSDSPDVTEDHPLGAAHALQQVQGHVRAAVVEAQGRRLHLRRDPSGHGLRLQPAHAARSVGQHPHQSCRRTSGTITVFGGNQMRPNLHVEDMVDAYLLMLEAPHEKIHGETFNIGFQNHSIADIARMVKRVVEEEFPDKGEIDIVTTPTNDMRSYHVNSDKVKRVLGFEPKRTIEDAVRDLARAFRNHLLPDSFDDDWYFNVRTMKKIGAR